MPTVYSHPPSDLSRDISCLACRTDLEGLLATVPGAMAIWQALPRRTVAAGEAVLRQGERAQRVWFVRQGLVRCYFLSADGRERNRSFHAEGSWVGWGAPPHVSPSGYMVEAIEPSQLVELAYTDLANCLRDLPAMRAVLDDGLSAAHAKQAVREADLLLLDAPERYRAFREEYRAVEHRLALHQVASYLGITNVALSRIRARMGLVAPRTRQAPA